ncbi:MAG: hypothetical protein A2X18_03205 [Bacteroidetes bacterium GWF2_40_14]|nr:MAG: hypothetical protein A2X18_03205 [Bacteroidetes bacterium GWF2_40_14]
MLQLRYTHFLYCLLFLFIGSINLCRAQEQSKLPVKFTAKIPEVVHIGEKFNVNIFLDIQDSWYIYAPTGTNAEQGMLEASITFELPEGIVMEEKIQWPEPMVKDLYQVYMGKIKIRPLFKVQPETKSGLYKIKAKLRYQSCNSVFCLPPLEENLLIEVKIK